VEIYETEEQQVAALKDWWKANARSTIIGAVLGLVLVSGWNYWQSYQLERAEKASALYQQVLDAVKEEKTAEAEKISQQIVQNYASTAYAVYATLMQAKLKIQSGDIAAAKNILTAQLKMGDDLALQHLARLYLVRLMLATGDYQKGLQIIAEIDPSSTKGFSANYDELTGDLYVALDRLGEARTAYQRALREGGGTPLLQFKLDDITAAEIL
jgi:predicted negative regulator of RcsB-dependent stress response